MPRFKRYVIYGKEKGIFLGQGMGLSFWSNLDNLDLRHATAFTAKAGRDMQEELQQASPEEVLELREVLTISPMEAREDECILAGLPRWSPEFKG